MPTSVYVVARDPDQLREAMRGHAYRQLGAQVGCSSTNIGFLVTQPDRRIRIELASRIETALGLEPGALFQVSLDHAPDVRPYLPTE